MLVNHENRVIKDLEEWKKMEGKWRELLGPEFIKQREFQKERLNSLKEIPKNYRGQEMTLSKDEKKAIRFVKAEIDRAEKILYPNAVVRTLVKIGEALKDVIEVFKQQRREPAEWKTVLKPRSEPECIRKNDVQEKKVVAKAQSKDVSINDKPIKASKDAKQKQADDDGPLIVKLRDSKGKGLSK